MVAIFCDCIKLEHSDEHQRHMNEALKLDAEGSDVIEGSGVVPLPRKFLFPFYLKMVYFGGIRGAKVSFEYGVFNALAAIGIIW
jgi:hypothetical protein